jgi:hypothetical protein
MTGRIGYVVQSEHLSMKLKPGSIHTLPEPTGLHRPDRATRLLNRTLRGKLRAEEAVAMVTGSGLVKATDLADKLTQRAKRALK